MLQATWTGYQLPAAVQDAAAVGQNGWLVIAGGVASRGGLVSQVVRLNPATGQTRPDGTLATPVGGAAVAVMRGRLVVFGGAGPRGRLGTGAPASGGRAAGGRTSGGRTGGGRTGGGNAGPAEARLPAARAGLVSVPSGATVYLVAGAAGAARLPSVLATADAVHYSVAGTLPVPVSYPGAVATGARLWVFGGMTRTGPTDVIQQVNLRTGRARVVGRLPWPLGAECAFVLRGAVFLAGGETKTARSGWPLSGWPLSGWPLSGGVPANPGAEPSAQVLRYDPASGRTTVAGLLPAPIAHAACAVIGGTAYLVGGTDGHRAVPAVVAVRLVPASMAGSARPTSSTRFAPWLAPVTGPGHLAPGSDTSALPADLLVADHGNNRLVVIDPQGRVRWVFPRPGDLAAGQTFRAPDDAFFSPDGRYIVATQEDAQVISVIDVATRRIVYRYGKPGAPGAGQNRVSNPDDAMLLPGGDLVAADIRNCRVIVVAVPAHRLRRAIGGPPCAHDPARHFGSPNGAFPMPGGGYLVTEINGDWADALSLSGRVLWSTNPPGVAYPSDTNQVYPGRLLTADYSDPGQVVEFTPAGRLVWRFGGLNQPSLALAMPNGDIVVNDDFNHRIVVIDPAAHRIVWQYGHTGAPGIGPGYLNDPDGLDLVPPDSMLIRDTAGAGAQPRPWPGQGRRPAG